jgi:hypothetical protein
MKPILEPIDIFHNIIFVIIIAVIGVVLIYQALPKNNFCNQVANSTTFTPSDIIRCYPETKNYYIN